MKILQAILAILVLGFCSFLVFKNNALSAQVAVLKEDLANARDLIAFQNIQIEKNALDLEQYKNTKQESDLKIETKYKKVYVAKNSTCEKELESIKELVNVFFESR